MNIYKNYLVNLNLYEFVFYLLIIIRALIHKLSLKYEEGYLFIAS